MGGGTLTFTSTAWFNGNSAPGGNGGGAMFVYGGTVIFNAVTSFISNSAFFGGGGCSCGGAIRAWGGSISFSSNVSFSGNRANDVGGAINANAGTVTFSSTASFTSNSAGSGGAINADGGTVTFNPNTFFTSNSAYEGGAIYAGGGALQFGGPVYFNGNTGGGSRMYFSVSSTFHLPSLDAVVVDCATPFSISGSMTVGSATLTVFDASSILFSGWFSQVGEVSVFLVSGSCSSVFPEPWPAYSSCQCAPGYSPPATCSRSWVSNTTVYPSVATSIPNSVLASWEVFTAGPSFPCNLSCICTFTFMGPSGTPLAPQSDCLRLSESLVRCVRPPSQVLFVGNYTLDVDFGTPFPLFRSTVPVIVFDVYEISPSALPSSSAIGVSPLLMNCSNVPFDSSASCALDNVLMPLSWTNASSIQCLRAGMNFGVESSSTLSLVFPSLWHGYISVLSVGVYDASLVKVSEANSTIVVPWRDPSPLYFSVSGFPFSWSATIARFMVIVGNSTVTTSVPFVPLVSGAKYTAATSNLLVGLATLQIAPNGVDFQPVYSFSVMPSAAIAGVQPMFMDVSTPFNLSLTTIDIYERGVSCIIATQTPSFSVIQVGAASCLLTDAVYGCRSFVYAMTPSNYTGLLSVGLSLPGFGYFQFPQLAMAVQNVSLWITSTTFFFSVPSNPFSFSVRWTMFMAQNGSIPPTMPEVMLGSLVLSPVCAMEWSSMNCSVTFPNSAPGTYALTFSPNKGAQWYAFSSAITFVGCSPGSQWNPESLTCDPCPSGTFLNPTDSLSCLPCPAGYYQNNVGSQSCKLCPPGLVPTSNATRCSSCPVGQIATVQGSCVFCAAGTEANSEQTVCLPCPFGTFSNASLPSCSLCPDSDRVPSVGQNACVTCPAGSGPNTYRSSCQPCSGTTFSDGISVTTCQVCPSGLVPNSVHTHCHACPRGQQPDPTHTVCQACPANMIQNGTSLVCSFCPPGLVPKPDQSQCRSCPAGQQPDPTSTVCQNGPSVMWQNGTMLFCALCPVGFVSNGNRTQCIRCPGASIPAAGGSCE